VAIVLCCAMVALTGCTPAQKQTTLQVITAVNARLPEVTAAADTVAATIAALAPADAALIAVCDTGFDTVAKTLQALTASYIANPSASTLAQIQAAINTLESTLNTATLNVVGIKDAASQKLALAALKGLLTVVTVVFAMIAPTESVAQLEALRETNTIHLARLRPYLDERELQQAAAESGVDLDKTFRQAEAFGF
jgi:poly-gamma-glutamate capsule biosynthesis protein CapA/YwtB (metallophosphatase superfamily)